MKKLVYIFIFLLVINGCSEEKPLTESNLNTETPVLNNVDIYLRENFTTPYNIEVFYDWNPNKVDFNRFLFPPTVEKVVPAMEAIKTIWLDTYNEVAGENFVKLIAPREIVLIGGINLNPSGTITLGLAEGGKRITFFNTDLVDLKDKEELTRFVSTIQHEYTHILNQTVPYDRETYEAITPSGYTAQWFNESIATARELGFITDYARSNEDEDFAEMVTALLSNSNAEYNAIIDGISSNQAKTDIRAKEALVVEYFKTEFNIDIYELQRVAAENVLKVLN
jgi:substrate import-associated zinc metallohydrolase lipoprotein